jgi:hypothetical protein
MMGWKRIVRTMGWKGLDGVPKKVSHVAGGGKGRSLTRLPLPRAPGRRQGWEKGKSKFRTGGEKHRGNLKKIK